MHLYVIVIVLFMGLIRLMENPNGVVMSLVYGFMVYFIFITGIGIANAYRSIFRGN